ncbi:IS110 family transposase [Microvirga sp. 0TCS3.31]
MHVTTIGLDLAKHVFQVHGIDSTGQVLIRRGELIGFFRRLPPCLVGMEACSTAHFWARELAALGHEVRLMPAAYVKPYVKRSKSDALDAEGICEAVTRPTMRFVAIKSPEQQAALMLHRTRDLLVRQRTMLVNALRSHLAEYGIIAPQGLPSIPKLREVAEKARGTALPELAWRCVRLILAQIEAVHGRIGQVEHEILAWHRTNELSQRLETIPGIGLITASALAATIPDPSSFRSGRHLAAWIGLVPRQSGTRGKVRLGHISKQGDRYLRRLLVLGASTLMRHARGRTSVTAGWINALLARRPASVVKTAIANKLARVAWAVLRGNQGYRAPAAAAA